jgi:hypothetical protein
MFQRNTSPSASMPKSKPSQKLNRSKPQGERGLSQRAASFSRLCSLSDTGDVLNMFLFRYKPAHHLTVHQRTWVWIEFYISFPGYKSCDLSSFGSRRSCDERMVFFATLIIIDGSVIHKTKSRNCAADLYFNIRLMYNAGLYNRN